MRLAQWFAALAALALIVSGAPAQAEIVRTDNVEAELVAERLAIAPGETITIALRKRIRDKWHTYWINPGDAGEPTRVDWTVPDGFETGPIQWPVPKKITLADVITNYGYEGDLLLPMTVTAPADAPVGRAVTLVADATWLVCEDICIPEEATLRLSLGVVADASDAPDGEWAEALRATVADVPQDMGFAAGLEYVEADAGATAMRLTVTDPALSAAIANDALRAVEFFPVPVDAIDHNAPQPVSFGADGLALDLTPKFGWKTELKPLTGVLAFEARRDGGWVRQAVEVTATAGGLAIGAAVPALAADSGAGGGGFFSGGAGVFGYLIGAFLGGLILNLMPCVFPVLSIKALGFVSKAHDDAGLVRRHGLVFLAGVLVTFLALAGVLLGLKAAGAAIGWGFQLQSPFVILALAVLMFAIGLNLLGVFEFGGSLQNVGGGLSAKDGDAGAFFTGVLAVMVATPCTAPFMGAALGFALVQPAYVALLVFTALGLGLAAPFVILSFAPGLLRLLPKPGAWMDTLKQFFAFPMFLTAVWLVWVLAQQAGASGVLVALLAMTALGFVVWTFKASAGGAGVGARVGRIAALGLFVMSLAGAAALGRSAPALAIDAEATTIAADVKEEAWSPERVAELRAQGKNVFVDFTAAWCITCQFNKRVALDRPAVRAAFAEHDVVFLTADWTNRDSVIAEELARHGRSGVPLYLLYGVDGDPMILPQLLRESMVLEAVSSVASRR